MASQLQTSGSLSERALYIERPEDDQVYDLLMRGEYCNILTSRQMGKSSLMVRLKRRLQAAGVRVVDVSLEATGGNEAIPSAGWYYAVLSALALKSEGRLDRFEAWWAERPTLLSSLEAAAAGADGSGDTTVKRVQEFFDDFILERGTTATAASARVVVFFDEVDITRNRAYTDDLFLALRALYNARTDRAELAGLSVCLLGVLSADELIKTRSATPYNVGATVRLSDFSRATCRLEELEEHIDRAGLPGAETVTRVLGWTGGQPFLTISLCESLVSGKMRGTVTHAGDVSKLVDKELRNPTAFAVHFGRIEQIVRERVASDSKVRALYLKVLRGKRVHGLGEKDEKALLLAGLVTQSADGTLSTRNRLYQRAFGKSWVNRVLPAPAVPRWVLAAVAVPIVALLVGSAWWLRQRYERLAEANREALRQQAEQKLLTSRDDTALRRAWQDLVSRGLSGEKRLKAAAARNWQTRTSELISLSEVLRSGGCEEEAWIVAERARARDPKLGPNPAMPLVARTRQVFWQPGASPRKVPLAGAADAAAEIDRCRARRSLGCQRIASDAEGLTVACGEQALRLRAAGALEPAPRQAGRILTLDATLPAYASYGDNDLIVTYSQSRGARLKLCTRSEVLDVRADRTLDALLLAYLCRDGTYGWKRIIDVEGWLSKLGTGTMARWPPAGYNAQAIAWLGGSLLVARERSLDLVGYGAMPKATVTRLGRAMPGARFLGYGREQPTLIGIVEHDRKGLVMGTEYPVCLERQCAVRAVATGSRPDVLAALLVELGQSGEPQGMQLALLSGRDLESIELGEQHPMDLAVVKWQGEEVFALPFAGGVRLLGANAVASTSWQAAQARVGLTVMDSSPWRVEPLVAVGPQPALAYSEVLDRREE